jgi:aminodeoxyfutalosine synthase
VNVNLAIAERATAGEVLTAAELDELAAADILSLGMLADEVRRARYGDCVTFSRVLECQGPQGARGAEAAQGAEVRLSELPGSLEEAEALIVEARMLAGSQLLTGFSLADIVARAWGDLVTVLRRLQRAGLNAVSEAPIDRVADLAVFKATEEAGLPVRCLSVQKPVTRSRTDYILAVRSIVQAVPAIRAVAPLPREQSIAVPTTGYDDVRSVAIARLGLPSIKNIQVDWTQYGPKLAQVALTFGANDLDRVSTADDESLGRRRTAVEGVRRNIAAAGFTAIDVLAGGSEDPARR